MSNEKKYTPGPLACRHSDGPYLPRIYDNKGRCIAIFKSLKNANDLEIFAAAPDLLEALEDIVSHVGKMEADVRRHPEILGDLIEAKHAIDKAKGNTDE